MLKQIASNRWQNRKWRQETPRWTRSWPSCQTARYVVHAIPGHVYFLLKGCTWHTCFHAVELPETHTALCLPVGHRHTYAYTYARNRASGYEVSHTCMYVHRCICGIASNSHSALAARLTCTHKCIHAGTNVPGRNDGNLHIQVHTCMQDRTIFIQHLIFPYAFACKHTHTHTHTHTWQKYTYLQTLVHVCMYACMYTCMHVCM